MHEIGFDDGATARPPALARLARVELVEPAAPAPAAEATADTERPERPDPPPAPVLDERILRFGRTDDGQLRIDVYDGAGRLVRSIPPNAAMARAMGASTWQG